MFGGYNPNVYAKVGAACKIQLPVVKATQKDGADGFSTGRLRCNSGKLETRLFSYAALSITSGVRANNNMSTFAATHSLRSLLYACYIHLCPLGGGASHPVRAYPGASGSS
jgi:hypothetical protein